VTIGIFREPQFRRRKAIDMGGRQHLGRQHLETIMKYTAISAIALLSLCSAAWAHTAPSASLRLEAAAPVQAMSLQPADRFVRNANLCAGEPARAVWSRDNSLLGYSCYENPNGG
jgi:hypothetical protein